MENIPLLDMKAQLKPLREELNQAIAGVIDSGGFILGEEVKRFEEEICEYSGARHAIGVSNGTDAITLVLEALGIGDGDRVICPSFTYYATAGAVARLGAEVVFADIDPKTYCLDPDSVRSYFREATDVQRQRTKAIIPVHLYGQCAQMDAILKIAKEHSLKVVEDTAQAFGASYKGQRAGTMADCGTVSFFPGKNLGACGDAGIVLTNDEVTAEKIRRLRDQGADPEDKYRHIYLGHNNRLDAIQAAVLRVKLRFLDIWNKRRAENAAYYNQRLKDADLITPYVLADSTHIYHQYVIRVKSSVGRDAIVAHLNSKGIDSRIYYPLPLHLQPCFEYLGYKKGDIPESERASRETFVVPVYPELTQKQMDYVIEGIKEAVRLKVNEATT